MSNRLEQFVHDHRDEFDDEEPGKKCWEDIRFQIESEQQRPSDPSKNPDPSMSADPSKHSDSPGNTDPLRNPNSSKRSDSSNIIRLNSVRWSAAAVLVLVMAGSIWFFKQHSPSTIQPSIADGRPSNPQSLSAPQNQPSSASQHSPKDSPSGATTQTNPAGQAPADSPVTPGADPTINEEMYHYARLVELKHKELKAIEKDEPLLYKQFAADVHNLDSVYQTLQQQLPKNPNREQLLEAMLQNLQLQMGLLNHQLDIIKQINHSKKTAYDKAYKTA